MTTTIITPTIGRNPEIVRRCIRSVNEQSTGEWRHIVCSDGKHEEAIRKLCQGDPRRTYTHLPQRTGHYGAGVRAAMLPRVDTEYVCFLDDDSILLPRYLEEMAKAVEPDWDNEGFVPRGDFAICSILHFGPVPGRSGQPPWIVTGVPPEVGNIDTLSVLARADAMKSVGWALAGYQSDGVTFAKLASHFPYVTVPEVLAVHL